MASPPREAGSAAYSIITRSAAKAADADNSTETLPPINPAGIGCSFAAAAAAAVATATVDPSNTGLTRSDNTAEITTATATKKMSGMFVFEPFDPTNCKIQRWLERLQIAFKIHRVPEEDKRDYLLHYMGSTTYDVLCNKLKNDEPQTKTFEEIVAILKEHFNPNPLEILENFKFANRKQRENESLSTYLMELEKLAQTCSFGDYLDKALRNQFMFGLQNRAIQSRLLEIRDLTLAKAKDIAFGMEMSNRGTDEIQGTVTPYPVQHIIAANKKKSKPASTQRKVSCYRCGDGDHLADKCRHLKTICNHCNKMGHLAKVCRTKVNRSSVHTLECSSELPADDDANIVHVFDMRTIQNMAGMFLLEMEISDRKLIF
uniref:uncharacterized protein LOC125906445 n=1 Tax=Anopheles coluzzii TaxID=1518534 RepID=UPI0020FF875E|nr:uncharacterized protein LOC125906445 [Anopheles coluzzii]